MKIDSVTHFTDEIGVVELSTFREELTLVIRQPLEVHLVTHEGGSTYISLKVDRTAQRANEVQDLVEGGVSEPPLGSITCPRCGRTSYNPNDIREGYCGNCHDWTGVK